MYQKRTVHKCKSFIINTDKSGIFFETSRHQTHHPHAAKLYQDSLAEHP
ncbi:hypothetical protein SAMN05518672_10343 [Chitinophaga sp. CF118]|nr:hypothetical protein SAMN05518672_10343 [Chitinophaga sp. CF118]